MEVIESKQQNRTGYFEVLVDGHEGKVMGCAAVAD
jgi:hypothetical protein